MLVLGTHSLRRWAGLGPFYAVLGALTAIMSWVTDTGLHLEVAGLTFVVGSTVFYSSLLLGVFVVYVFDGPRKARIAILTVAAVSVLMPTLAAVFQAQMRLPFMTSSMDIPVPDLRINIASVLTTIADLIFLAVAWEFLGHTKMKRNIWLRSFMVLLGVMWLDVLLFSTGAFAGTPNYLSIMGGTFVTRCALAFFAWPFLLSYLHWEGKKSGSTMKNRPVLAILTEFEEVKEELTRAEQEIERRKKIEAEKQEVIERLEETLKQVRRLEGLLPVCSECHRIRVESDDKTSSDRWVPMEDYVEEEAGMKVTHGLCSDCLRQFDPDVADRIQKKHHNRDGDQS